ncbi:hypothetical protein E1292_21625 [Nonomuraea deserti]|uniref:Lipase family protein n=1 Tax=Nonomuraea deserti TaxID=1848322 RepID=A0A4R4VSF8_9ACTN|nr:hypothetical protein [Nonomuraea deserti]TDD03150.1 hypothetical protein E1292_21625 [Nonomuraea deserti]
MDGFLDETCGGVTELRVHGVSGTPPAGMLNHPHPRLVAGDRTTGFYRRWWTAGRPVGDRADVPGVRRREAYAWGGLTSGGRTIALWLLLLPFSLANLSYFMLPRPRGGDRLRHLAEAAQRLFALLLTGTLVGAVTRACVDLVGWQCTAAGRACTDELAPVWLRWMGAMWGHEPSKRLAVTALAPLLVVVLLWWIARRTWRRDERKVVPDGDPDSGHAGNPDGGHDGGHAGNPDGGHDGGHDGDPGAGSGAGSGGDLGGESGAGSGGGSGGEPGAGPVDGPARERLLLARARLWHGGAPVWRLRIVHVAFAIASIGLAVAAPFAGTPLGLALTAANAGVELAAAVLVVLPWTGRRLDPHSGGREPTWLKVACHALRVAAPLVFLATFWATLAGLPPSAEGLVLPGMGAGPVQFALMLGLGAFILAATWVLARMDRPGAGRDPLDRPAMGGLAAWFMLMVAAGCANVLALGVLFWTATFFGVPGSLGDPGPPGRRLFIDDPVWWTAALVPLLAAAFAGVAIALWLIRRAEAGRLVPELEAHYGESGGAAVARKWALAALTDRAGLVLGVLTGIGVAGFAVVTVIYQLQLYTPKAGFAGLLASIGSWATAATVVGLALLGRRTYGSSRLRRTVGIVWDVSTFWPRAIHPLAPPCYTERVIPELVARVGRLAATDRDTVVLSGHSQGSVIAAALVLQLDPDARRRVRLLTHGSPLRRLYAAFFPAYFAGHGLPALRDAVAWRNLYRLSDPIGGPAFRRVDPLAAEPDRGNTVDRFCWDPLRPAPGEPLPEARWHSGYWLDPPYHDELARLISPSLPPERTAR